MDAMKLDGPRDFVTRQYAYLMANGLDEPTARARLREILGEPAVAFLEGGNTESAKDSAAHRADARIAQRLIEVVNRSGGSAADLQVSLVHSFSEARLFALDWWRPVRTFLAYVLFLLLLALVIASIYMTFVLPAFGQLDQALGVRGGAAGWVVANGGMRLFAPLALMAMLLVMLAIFWLRMRERMARLQPLAGQPRFGWLHGASGTAFEVLRCLEFAAALKSAGVTDAAVLEPALQVAGWPAGAAFRSGGADLGEKLKQAESLGTFAAELEWQRRLHWSTTQSQLELSRDRLILFSRVLFYLLIGVMVTLLYVPVFSVASMVGVQG